MMDENTEICDFHVSAVSGSGVHTRMFGLNVTKLSYDANASTIYFEFGDKESASRIRQASMAVLILNATVQSFTLDQIPVFIHPNAADMKILIRVVAAKEHQM